MTNKEIKDKTNNYIASSYGRFDVAIKQGKGAACVDFDGKSYIDFTSGIGVNCLGFCDTKWADAVITQVKTLNHTSNLYYTEPAAKLAEKLAILSGMKKAFFCNSGAEANECAIKTARKYSFDKYGKGRHEIITLKNSFHGRTMATISATGQDVFHQYFDPFLEGFVFAEANNIDDTLSKISNKTCAIIIEIIQGEGGILDLDENYIKAVIKATQENYILLIVDEVQTGIGRTGKMFGFKHYNFIPNIVTCAKGLGGGLPIGAALFDEKTQNVLTPGTHAETFGANPIVCAGALEVLDRLASDELNEITKKGAFIKEEILKSKHVKGVNGRGLMVGIEVDVDNKTVVNKCIEKGLLVLTAKQKVRLLPPLTISYDEINKGLEILKSVLEEI
ncbi:MAG: acetylornithine/succinylornithine family transaminase [Eubacteriaceae bacterium]|nr:acetylornithine/succinylornithine family transaminase [Eubacteriaceae bacterium]